MVAPPPDVDIAAGMASDKHPQLAHDPLYMLVTSEPVNELDDALRCLSGQLHQARHDSEAAARLRRRIDGRLDERNTFRLM